MLFYSAAPPLSTSTLNHVAGLIRTHRRAIGSRWRALDPGAQALLTLTYLHRGEALHALAAGFGISAATARRRTRETIRLHARLRGPGERMFAQLKKWTVLDQLRCDPAWTSHISKALQVLNDCEHSAS